MECKFDIKKMIFEMLADREPGQKENHLYETFLAKEQSFCEQLSPIAQQKYEELQRLQNVYDIEKEKQLISYIVDFF